jgi:hypothetical protein
LLADGRWLSPGTPASSTTKADRLDIAEILLKVALKHQKSKIISIELEIKDTTDTDRSTSYLNLHQEIDSEGPGANPRVLVIGLYELLDPTT